MPNSYDLHYDTLKQAGAKEMSHFPIQRLETLREEMLRCSGLLKKYGYEEHGKEMFGAAKILLTWIEGIGNENIQ